MSPATLAPYVCRMAGRFEGTAPPPWLVLHGTLVKVDLSGFTALTERIAGRVDGGAEDISGVITALFERLIALVHDDGGDVLQFGGDALTVWFDGEDHRGRAVGCLDRLHAAMRQHGKVSAAGRVATLRMSAGAASGELIVAALGATHREVVLVGRLVSQVLAHEAAAEPGTTVIDTDSPAGHTTVLSHRGAPSRHNGPRAPEGAAVADAGAFLDSQIRLAIGADGGLAQHRTASVAFVTLRGTDAASTDAAATVARVGRFVGLVDAAVVRYGICWSATDSAPDGVVALLFGGAPAALGDDAERVLRAVQDILDGAGADGLTVQCGVASGDVFAADVGHHSRRAYALLGDTVNLAARLMGKAAPGCAVVDEPTRARSQVGFEVLDPRELTLKGKREPVAVSDLGAAIGHRTDGALAPIIGRDLELRRFDEALEALDEGRGSIVAVLGPTGSGRSRLLAEVASRCGQRNHAVVHVRGSRLLSGQPYGPLGPLFLHIAARRPDLAASVAAPSHADDMVVDLARAAQAAQARHAAIAAALSERPTVLLVDDADAVDGASADLLGLLALTTTERPLAVIAAAVEMPEYLARRPVDRIPLPPLDDGTVRALVQAHLPSFTLPEAIDAIVATAAGSPAIAVGRARGGQGGTVAELITSQLDRLPVDDLVALRQLAVWGEPVALQRVNAVVGAPERLRGAAVQPFLLRAGELIGVEGAVVQDLLVRGLPKAERRRLHLRCADALGTDSAANPFALMRHLLGAERWDEAATWARSAARTATTLGALAEASQAWAAMLTAVRRAGAAPVADDLALAVGVATERGELDVAASLLGSVKGSLAQAPSLLLAAAKLADQRGEHALAVRRAQRLLRTFDGEPAMRARILIALVEFRRGRIRRAAELLDDVLGATDLPPALRAQAHLQMEMAAFELGDGGSEGHAIAAEHAFELADDPVGVARSRLNRAAVLIERGELAGAVRLLDDTMPTFVRNGTLLDAVIARYNRGLALVRQGRVDAATEDSREGIRLAVGLGWPIGEGYHRLLEGQVASFTSLEPALAAFDHAAAIFRSLDAQAWVYETDVRRAATLLWHGDDMAARRLLDAVEAIPDRPDDPALDIALDRLQGWLLGRSGDFSEARERFDRALRRARSLDFGYEVALALWALEHWAFATGAVPEPGWAAERTGLFEAAGVTVGLRSLSFGPSEPQ